MVRRILMLLCPGHTEEDWLEESQGARRLRKGQTPGSTWGLLGMVPRGHLHGVRAGKGLILIFQNPSDNSPCF